MPENLLLALIFNENLTRGEFEDWGHTVKTQINELYKFKEMYWKEKINLEYTVRLYEGRLTEDDL